jgi:hypothetical protein
VPTEPTTLALPGTGKTLEQFQADDAECRRYAIARVSPGANAATSDDAQRRYDFAFVQCMYAKGHKVPVSGGYTSTAPAGGPPPSGAPPAGGFIPPPAGPRASPPAAKE